jgi:hypothetical protein
VVVLFLLPVKIGPHTHPNFTNYLFSCVSPGKKTLAQGESKT